jgi:Tfp pilus assembly protein PilN
VLDIDMGKKDRPGQHNSGNSLVTESEIVGLDQMDNRQIILVFSLIVLGIFVVVAILVFALTSSKSTTLKNKDSIYSDLTSQIKSNKDLSITDEQYKTIDKGLKTVNSYLSQKTNWSIFLKELQNVTPQSIVFSNISVNEKTKITSCTGQANSYSDISLLIASLRNSDKFANIKLTSANLADNGSVTFSIEFELVEKNLK